jgi:hypothetical protein
LGIFFNWFLKREKKQYLHPLTRLKALINRKIDRLSVNNKTRKVDHYGIQERGTGNY